MSSDNYKEILEEVCEKLNNIDTIKDIDVLNIKNSVESIENIISDSQAKSNFEEIKEKLENIAYQVDSCNETLLKDLYNDINQLKETSMGIGSYLENLKNIQSNTLTSAEFEEFQKQQLDLSIKSSAAIYKEINALKENTAGNLQNSDTIKNLQEQLSNIHSSLAHYVEKLAEDIKSVSISASGFNADEMGAIMADINTLSQKNINQTNTLIKELQNKFDDFKNIDQKEQLSKISEIYDSLTIIHAWIEKVGFLNKSIENVYARLGANIDFDDVSEKIDIIYENISALNNWTMKVDNVDLNISDLLSKFSNLSSCIDETRNINNGIEKIKNKLDTAITDDVDFDDLSNKMDIVYENLSSINEWANKVDKISDKVNSINQKVEESSIESDVKAISQKVDNINTVFDENDITSKIDLIYDNINLLNDWVNKIDGIAEKSNELDSKLTDTNYGLNKRIEGISKTLFETARLLEDIPSIKDKLDEVYNDLNLITRTTKNETESYIYTLLDIESDFLKLHKFLDEKTGEIHTLLIDKTDKIHDLLADKTGEINNFLDNTSEKTTQDINSLKERFELLNDDISSISKRTNKLILSADDANKEFKTCLETFKNTLQALDETRLEFNPDVKFNALNEKIDALIKLMQNSVTLSKNLNNAFVYLAEWVDLTGRSLNSIQNDIESVKLNTKDLNDLKNTANSSLEKISELEKAFNSYKTDETSEIKSLLTGIIVQLNTALTPDIDSLNERIDKLLENNNAKFSELELVLQEKIKLQEKQIVGLEKKFDNLSEKFDRLIDVMGEEQGNMEIKDVLNFIAAQMSAANEKIISQQSEIQNLRSLSEGLALKVSSFDENIGKIVSYIEED